MTFPIQNSGNGDFPDPLPSPCSSESSRASSSCSVGSFRSAAGSPPALLHFASRPIRGNEEGKMDIDLVKRPVIRISIPPKKNVEGSCASTAAKVPSFSDLQTGSNSSNATSANTNSADRKDPPPAPKLSGKRVRDEEGVCSLTSDQMNQLYSLSSLEKRIKSSLPVNQKNEAMEDGDDSIEDIEIIPLNLD